MGMWDGYSLGQVHDGTVEGGLGGAPAAWLTDHGSWLIAYGTWPIWLMARSVVPTTNGPAHGPWLIAHEPWLVARGLCIWLTAHDVHGPWSIAHGP